MAKLDILLPTYKRPHALQKVVDNIRETTKNSYELYLGLENDDIEGMIAARNTGAHVVVNPYSPGYSNTIQVMYELSSSPIIFHANDDFLFLPNWDETPVAMFDTDWVQVVGVKQQASDTSCSAIQLFRRKYIQEQSGVMDMPNRVFYPYNHNYQDTEMTLTAQHRGVWAKCDVPCIEHQHPGLTGIGTKDATYLKNDATAGIDEATFNGRKHLFS